MSVVQLALEMLDYNDIARIPTFSIDNIAKALQELTSAGLEAKLSPNTDYLLIKKN